MIVNLKLVTRNLLKGKIHSVFNIIGLTLGLSCSLAVILWVKDELSYDKFLPDARRTYRLTFETSVSGNRLHFARCWEKWISQIPETFPQIEELVRLEPYRHTAIKIGESKFYSDRVFATDSNFFKVFGIEIFFGDIENVLKEPYSAVISSSLAGKFFGKANPVGQTILLSGEYDDKMVLFNVKGIMKDSPANSHIHFDILTSFVNPQEAPAWAYVYLLLKPKTNPKDVLSQFPSFIKEVEKENDQISFTPHLQKITDIHLFSDKDREVEQNGNITSIYLFIFITLILLLVSLVNYYNLSKARLLSLNKQMQIQRISGSSKSLIVAQSLAESGISTIIAFLLTIILFNLPGAPANFLFEFNLLRNGFPGLFGIWPFAILLLTLSILSGSLPSILYILTTDNSLKVNKEVPIKSLPRFSSYGVLMTIQFFLSIGLLIAAITIHQQKEFILSRSLGKMSTDILVFKRQNWEIRFKYKAFREKALQNPLVKSVTASMEEPTGETLDAMQFESPQVEENHKYDQLYVLSVEDNFLNFFKIPLIAGRNFSQFNPDRKGEEYILNETAVKQIGWTPEQAIGQPFKIKFGIPDIFYGGNVVGVVSDFNFNTLKQKIKPYVLFQKPIFYLCFLVEVNHTQKKEAINYLKSIWEKELPDYPFQYEFINDLYKSAYKKELKQERLTAFFSLLAIVIICLGLYSVTSVLVARRTKEIGIRKVNGASITDLMFLLSSDFIIWFAIALMIACPAAWLIMNKWLQSFVYKTEIKLWFFAVSGIVVLFVTMLTVSLQTWRAASRNPVEALKYE